MGYYSAFKTNEILVHDTTWMKFEDIVLSEIDTKGQIFHDSTYVRYLNSQNHGERKMWGLGEGENGELPLNG